MPIIDAFLVAIATILQPFNFVVLLLAVLVGFTFGMIPGLGGTTLLALLIPLTFGLDALVAFMVLAAANAGTEQGGAITAILLNTPGKPPNAATILDGYPMAQQGRANEAIGASVAASAVGAVLGIAVLVLSLPFLVVVVLQFGPPELFWLGVWGLTMIAVIVRGRLLTGVLSAALGLLFAMHGVNPTTASTRWTYGYGFMVDGFQLVPALIGLFAIAEMMHLASTGPTISDPPSESENDSGPDGTDAGDTALGGARSVLEHKWLTLRSSLVGLVVGAIPGAGGTVANYISYFQAVQTSRNSETFGTGDVRGVIASEASNDAKEGGAYIPTLGFGVPGSASMAVLFGAFLLHGVSPGPLMLQTNLDIVAVIVLAALLSNVLASGFGLALATRLSKLTRIDISLIAPFVMALSFYASYAIHNDPHNLVITGLFGLIGFAMIKLDISRVPLILGMVLGPIVEEEFFRSLQLSNQDLSVFIHSELSVFLALLTTVSLVTPVLHSKLRDRSSGAVRTDSGRSPANPESESSLFGSTGVFPISYPMLTGSVYLGLVVWAAFLLHSSGTWSWQDRLFPLATGLIALVVSVLLLFRVILRNNVPPIRRNIRVSRNQSSEEDELRAQFERSVRSGHSYARARVERLSVYMLAWCVALPASMYYLGFAYAIPVFVCIFDYTFSRNLRRAVAIAVGFSIAVYVFFVVLLDAHLWEGALVLLTTWW